MYFASIKYFNRIKSAVLFIIVFALSGPAVMADGGADTKILKDITPVEAFDLIQENKENIDFIILDVRTEPEYKSGHIENAENIDYYLEGFKDELGELDKNKTYLIYCASGNRSGKALKIMDEMGFQKAYNVLGGIKGWKSKGLPVVE
ncbi:MAG: rhodanese-like domain-containing protein [Spirochaetes bacterium]|nr:rhodanese-like domain-containing protein [Spirochaetota bacterium]